MKALQPADFESIRILFEDILRACEVGQPFHKSGKNGVFDRKEDLSPEIRNFTREKLVGWEQYLLNERHIVKCVAQGTKAKNWLAGPDQALATAADTYVFEPGCAK